MNVSDSERAASALASSGYEVTDSEENADVIVLNTCSVREKAEHKLYTKIGRIRNEKPSKMIGVMGCVAQLEGETLFDRSHGIDFVVGTKAVGRLSEAISAADAGVKRFTDLGEREFDHDWNVSGEFRHSQYVAFVPIIEGCNKFCTYCIVPFSRGREKSLPAHDIVRQVLELKRDGIREVHLIGQNVNSYRPVNESGLESVPGATPFSRLLRAVAATGIERVKFTTSFPRDFHDDIVNAIEEHENLCNWVHLPVQSGSDRVLRAMRRGHTVARYKQKIDRIRNSSRSIGLTTDIIVGFPGETETDFLETVDLVRFCEYDMAYIFKYSPRPGTPAAELSDDVSPAEKTRRFLELELVQKANQARSLGSFVGNSVSVLAERVSERGARHLTGHTTCHKVVNFAAPENFLGRIIDVKIKEAKSNTLFGEYAGNFVG